MLFDYIDYGDGNTGIDFTHTYTIEGIYTPIVYQHNTYSGDSVNTCSAPDITANLIQCGDGNTEGEEQCDDGNLDTNDACTNSCTIATCGDTIWYVGVEECDDGNVDNTDSCTNSCENPVCGDEFVQASIDEQCDFGDTNIGDGCDNSCQWETPSCSLVVDITG